MRTLTTALGLFLLVLERFAFAFDISRNDNVVAYWGQNSYGSTNPDDPVNTQKPLVEYCSDDSVDALPIAFLTTFFGPNGLPKVDFTNICTANGIHQFANTELADCSFMASDIKTCQSMGKIVTLSLGGAFNANTFTGDDEAVAFADQIWGMFFEGSSTTRPFGDAVLDGIDLDIEQGGTVHYPAFVKQLQKHFETGKKKYYVTAAPQCPLPDLQLGDTLDAVPFDAIYVQFYNNPCGLQTFGTPAWNFGAWDNWAKTVSPNKNVKVYIGAPGGPKAAGSGYVDPNQLVTIVNATRAQYSSFGGVSFWDISQASVNNRLDKFIKQAIQSGPAPAAPSPTSDAPTAPGGTSSASDVPSSSTANPPPTSTPAGASASCANVPAWDKVTSYPKGQRVTFDSHLWTCKWWTQGDTPMPSTSENPLVWEDDGPC